jgi:hypothetical protein
MSDDGQQPLTMAEFMWAACNLPWDPKGCQRCGGSGLVADMCCNGAECGCRGRPIDFGPCDCGAAEPTDDDLRKVLEGVRDGRNSKTVD